MMKMKLLQLICLAVHSDGVAVAGSKVLPNGVTVVNDLERNRVAGEVNRGQMDDLRVSDVNRRLLLSRLAGCKLRAQISPMLGPVCAGIAPFRTRTMLVCSFQRSRHSNQRKHPRNQNRKHLFYRTKRCHYTASFAATVNAVRRFPIVDFRFPAAQCNRSPRSKQYDIIGAL